MERILVSSCLLGRPVRYDGRGKPLHGDLFERWRNEGRLVPFCPEVSGGLPVPRPPAEIVLRPNTALPREPSPDTVKSAGAAVLDGAAQVLTDTGADVTEHFVRGAKLALESAERSGARIALLKEGSPSCGSGRIYDGTFTGTPIADAGVTTVLLERVGIQVFSEDRLPELEELLKHLEK